jgi:hypothetical protein
VRRSLPLRPAILRMVWQVLERFGEQVAHSPQSIAWCRRLWRNPARQSLPLQPAIRRMVWQVREQNSGSKSPIVRNPSHGLARRDCPRCADDRRRAYVYVVDSHGWAYAPRSWLYTRLCIAKVAISSTHVRACKQERRASARRGVRKRICKGDTANMRETAAAGLGLADVIAIAVAGEALIVFRATAPWHCECASANHGGLTPPALGCTCVCASQKSPFHRQTFAPANRSGGREPAVGGGNAFARAIPHTCRRPSPVCQRTSLQSRSRNHGGLTSSALGCTCVCASQKSPFRRHTFAPANRSDGCQPAVGPADVCVMAIPPTRSAADCRAVKERRA